MDQRNRIKDIILWVLVVMALMALMALVACAPTQVSPSQIVRDGTARMISVAVFGNNNDVLRVVDDRAGVVCWVVWTYGSSSISCLPLNQTLLGGQ